ncbi:MAG: methyltransferase domain-containing protein [Rubrivivax sp.]|nr:MAG: methyltransferase domain-containing protein [Rubrivivax sp.]
MHSLTLDRPDLSQQHEDARHADGKRLVRALGVSRGHKVLDIGCGTGRLGEHVAQIVGTGGEVIGIDPLPLRIAVAARRGPAVFKASVGAAEDLSRFEAGHFDVVTLNSVLHWSQDQPKVLGEIRRVLRKNGRLGLSVANRGRFDQRTRLVVEALSRVDGVDMGQVPSDVPRAVGWHQLSALINQAGFSSHTLSDEVLVDYHLTLDHVLDFHLNSALGAFLLNLEDEQYGQLRQWLAERVAPLTTSKGIRLERYLIYAVANRHR